MEEIGKEIRWLVRFTDSYGDVQEDWWVITIGAGMVVVINETAQFFMKRIYNVSGYENVLHEYVFDYLRGEILRKVVDGQDQPVITADEWTNQKWPGNCG